jgi:hypothetical protein
MDDEQVAILQRNLIGTQEMLGQVLLAIGKPVSITKEKLKESVPEGAQIDISEEGDSFVFSIKFGD